ncbi:hypothetical protein P171DRAFT_502090 [Karstenula rhodostoma CBS 690.94]|uniref:Epidermal growth factor receptor-like transmembrane-juxtamembrane segment domain-containing protein n=1 Tax=Karstenula rhodostoma CBS 690.94 TaxID=1392251 RepID=A0A9P4P5W8_9PLEO|nr:hypothetical protein P171DRAFT_502090 [Karstenula rhodostoma CBS 690.94]
MASLKSLFGGALCLLLYTTFASNIATFEDQKCKESKENMNGPNGYPNGTCMPLDKKGSYKSFQIVGLDGGCSVTLYGKDSDPGSPCSSETQLEFPRIGTCYNASWLYYSIDSVTRLTHCHHPTHYATPTATENTFAESPHKKNTGAIAGGVVGGVVGLVLVAASVFFSVKRNRRLQQEARKPVSATAPNELPTQDVKYKIYSHEASLPPQEMGRNSVYISPSELHNDTSKEV